MSRFFFALKPDNETRDKIVSAQKQLNLSGRLIKPENLHITLLFMGKPEPRQIEKVIGFAQKIHCLEFSFALDVIGYFKKAQVSWLGLSESSRELINLHSELLISAQNSHIPIQTQKFIPHLTLERNTKVFKKQNIEPIQWKVKDFVLYQSIDTQSGVHYQVLHQFPCG
ncbi:MAG: RNA 2',3'-cyclic phosphodiesterase [Gammaproteobacteria bacterium]|nr:RNA 2',3'-cyclic phosphodiesterase [Gammaproteobacteria bacterium]